MPNPTFIPFLTGAQSGLSLEIAAYKAGLNFDQAPRALFPIGSHDAPLTRLLGGRVRYAALDTLRPMIMLLSRDDYPRIDHAESALTNSDIDRLWREAFRMQWRNPALAIFAGQMDKGGDPVLFDPLFYCRKTARFFAPPCPRCGQILSLCTDDALLTERGLKPYASSLRRYLTCRSCGTEEAFYAYDPDESEKGLVLGPEALIRSFGGVKAGDLPCRNCPEHDLCYGRDDQAAARIVPVAFYPFYLMVFEAAALSALDFLDLAAGTAFCEPVQGLFREREPVVPIQPAVVPPPGEGAEIVSTMIRDEHAGEIKRILAGIRTRWEQAAAAALREETPESAAVAEPPRGEERAHRPEAPLDATILQAETVAAPVPPADDDFHTETVIMHHPPRERAPAEALEQTVLMRTVQEPPVPVTAPAVDLEATVVLEAPAQTKPMPPQSEPSAPDDLTATVIMGAPAQPTPSPQPPKPATDDDGLAETVIIKPKK